MEKYQTLGVHKVGRYFAVGKGIKLYEISNYLESVTFPHDHHSG